MTDLVEKVISLFNSDLSNEDKYRSAVKIESEAVADEDVADNVGEVVSSFIMYSLNDNERELIETGEWDK